ncbi:hypothetical protein ZIOFF_017137 [Zingiber officinale]|uniref:mevalonate kinase n=1 Tax=Zingiber officinale TaxID=94328 RepID=A0A8J5HBA4_ZINOF|nr:hypothetical protein ZIOFF_017137 [Zingiber officinale]
MTEVRARSPGKIILSGEHAVASFSLELKDMDLVFSWPLSRLKKSLGDSFTASSSPVSCTEERMKLIATLVEEQAIPEARISLSLRLGFVCVVLCVSLVAALLALSDVIVIDKSKSGWNTLCNYDLELVNKWAYEGGKIIHGKPSGIDNTCPYHRLGGTQKALVASVSERASRHQDAMAAVFNAVDSISKELSAIIQSAAVDDRSVTAREEKIEELMEMNQGLLQSMGVSHASIQTVLRTTLKYKLASKLTGAGGGGCVLTLLPTRVLSSGVIDKVISELESCGFQCLKTEVAGKGLEICFSYSTVDLFRAVICSLCDHVNIFLLD